MTEQFTLVLIWITLIMELILFCLLLRNIIRYVCKQRKYREFQIFCFYSIAFWILALRISFHIVVLLMNKTDTLYKRLVWEAWVIEYFARQLENILAV